MSTDFFSEKDVVHSSHLMGEEVKRLLKECGIGVKIRPFAKIARPEVVAIDDYCIIDDFTFIVGGKGIHLGKFIHISSFCSITGGGTLDMEDFSGLSAGCRIITGSDDFSGKSLTNPCVPDEFKPFLHRGHVRVCKHVILGTNTIVHPDVTIGAYAATGSGTIVTRNLEPEGIYVGVPARRVGDRFSRDLDRLEAELIEKYYGIA